MYTNADLHGFVKAILRLIIVLNGIIIAILITDGNAFREISPLWDIIETMLSVASIIAAFQILQIQKNGYLFIVATHIVRIAVVFFETEELLNSPMASTYYNEKDIICILTQSIITNIGLIIFLSLILLLRKNGHSGFDVLWERT